MNNIHIGFFLGGLLFIANVVYGLLTGNIITIGLDIVSSQEKQFSFYMHLIACGLIGGIIFFRSFLSFGNNREYHDDLKIKEKEHIQAMQGDCSVDFPKLVKVIFVMLVIFAIIFFALDAG